MNSVKFFDSKENIYLEDYPSVLVSNEKWIPLNAKNTSFLFTSTFEVPIKLVETKSRFGRSGGMEDTSDSKSDGR